MFVETSPMGGNMIISERDKDKFEMLYEIVKGGGRSIDFIKKHEWERVADELVQGEYAERLGGTYHPTEKGKAFIQAAERCRNMPDARISFP
jgi:predicted transcriptional regulator